MQKAGGWGQGYPSRTVGQILAPKLRGIAPGSAQDPLHPSWDKRSEVWPQASGMGSTCYLSVLVWQLSAQLWVFTPSISPVRSTSELPRALRLDVAHSSEGDGFSIFPFPFCSSVF